MRTVIGAMLAALIVAWGAAAARAQGAPEAEAVVKALYARMSADIARKKYQNATPYIRAFFTPSLTSLYVVVAKGSNGRDLETSIDADLLLDAQNVPEKLTLKSVTSSLRKPGDALVTARSAAFGEERVFKYFVRQTPGGWKIDDSIDTNDGRMREHLAAIQKRQREFARKARR